MTAKPVKLTHHSLYKPILADPFPESSLIELEPITKSPTLYLRRGAVGFTYNTRYQGSSWSADDPNLNSETRRSLEDGPVSCWCAVVSPCLLQCFLVPGGGWLALCKFNQGKSTSGVNCWHYELTGSRGSFTWPALWNNLRAPSYVYLCYGDVLFFLGPVRETSEVRQRGGFLTVCLEGRSRDMGLR